MASTSSLKISPIDDEVGMENQNNDYAAVDPMEMETPMPHQDDEPKKLKQLLKRVAAHRSIYHETLDMFTYANLKATMKWFLETASCNITFTVSSSNWKQAPCIIIHSFINWTYF